MAGSSTLSPPVKLPNAGSSRRVPSPTKQGPAAPEPGAVQAAPWDAGGRRSRRPPPHPQHARRRRRRGPAAVAWRRRAPAAAGIVVAADPDPASAAHRPASRSCRSGERICDPAPVVEAVAQAHDRRGPPPLAAGLPAGRASHACRRAAAGCRGARRRCPSPDAGRPRRSSSRAGHHKAPDGVQLQLAAPETDQHRQPIASATSSATASSKPRRGPRPRRTPCRSRR